MCVQKGFDVVCFDRYNSNNHWGWLQDSPLKNDFEMKLGDIRDLDSVNKAMIGCSNVFHLAAMMSVPYSYHTPLAFIRTNIDGTYNVLESAKQLGLEGIYITSTSETYGTAQYTPIDEHHPSVGQSPYAATKIAADQLSISYHRAYDLPITIVRPFNTYGPRQSTRAVIPTIVTQTLGDQDRLVLGTLKSSRDFLYVKDLCHAYLDIHKSSSLEGETVNVSTNTSVQIGELARKILTLANIKKSITEEAIRLRPWKSEVWELVGDNKKLTTQTSWKPAYTINEGLSETMDWYRVPANMEICKTTGYSV
jgi:dTDP-glucose 4,6-dehydratase